MKRRIDEKARRYSAVLAAVFIALLAAAGSVTAQGEKHASAEPAMGAEQTTDEDSDNQYLIGPGDVLDIRVFNRPQLSRESVRVDGRGMIRLPLINDVRAQCRTETQLAREISSKYMEYLRNPHIEVFIKDYQSKPVVVLGAVREPGRFQLQRRVHLLEIISLAGGLTEHAGGRIQVTHSRNAHTCDEAGELRADAKVEDGTQDTVEWYDINELLRSTTTGEAIPYVRPGDTISLLEAEKAFVVGNVTRPSIIPLKERITISQAVAIAGGTLPDSNLDKVRIIRQTSGGATKSEIIVDLKAINKQQADDIVLQANDIVDVPTSSGKKFLRGLINTIAPTISRLPVRVIQ